MAHEVYTIDGKASVAYTGAVPWHGLGQSVDHDASIEEWRRQAMLEWRVNEAPVIFNVNGEARNFRDRKVLYRSDNGEPLSVVTSRYKVVQPEDVLEFFRSLVSSHGFRIDTAGSLRGGRRVWALAKTNREARLGRRDVIRPYLLLATSYDAGLATTAALTTVRVVCNNTLQIAYLGAEQERAAANYADGGYKQSVKVPHISIFDPDAVKLDLGLMDKSFAEFMQTIDALSNVRVTREQAVQFFMDLLHDKKRGDDYSDVPKRVMKTMLNTYDHGVGQDTETARGTAWGLVTAVTRYLDHERPERPGRRDPGAKLDYAWFGQGSLMKQRAMREASKIAAMA